MAHARRQTRMLMGLGGAVVLFLLVCLLQTACRRHQASELSDFRRWASDPEAREEPAQRMLARQALAAYRADRAAARERESRAMNEAELDRFLRSLDLADLAKNDDREYGSESPRAMARDRLRGALARLVLDEDMRRWDTFESILDSQALFDADEVIRRAVEVGVGADPNVADMLDAFGVETTEPDDGKISEFHERLLRRILGRARRGARVSSAEALTGLLIDARRTSAVIGDPEVFDIGSFECSRALNACLERNVLPDVAYLRAMLREGKDRLAKAKPPKEGELGDNTAESVAVTVNMLGRQRAEGIELEARSLLETGWFDGCEGILIAQAITIQYGIENMDEYMAKRYAKEVKRSFPFHRGDELFRTWVSVGALDEQVRNGGFAQYFDNDYGYQFPDAIAAFERIGERGIHKLLTRIRDAFDARKPVGDYSSGKLQQEFDRLEELLDESTTAYYAQADRAYAKLNLYLMDRIRAEREANQSPEGK